MIVVGVDPGPTQSGFVYLRGQEVTSPCVFDNRDLLRHLSRHATLGHVLAVEMIASYGMPVGREVFETCVWVGRFLQAWGKPDEVMLVYRQDVKLHLCGQPRAKDANVRQALLDWFPRTGGGKTPQVGTKKQPGPLFGVSTHAWPALGVAVVAAHRLSQAAKPRTARVRLA